jgi:glycosyltransferase involved in cell wall biosynthesis
MFEATVKHDLRRAPLIRSLDPGLSEPLIERASKAVAALAIARRQGGPAAGAPAFQRRRDVNVDRLSRADCVIAMSRRVAEIHEQLGVDPSRVRTLQLTLSHIERLTPRRATGTAPLTFATLAGFESAPKGARLLLETMQLLSDQAQAGRFRLLVFGHIDPQFAGLARDLPGIDLRGPFGPAELDGMLDPVDVGIVPSVWEEAYAYAGIEFLAKGIPVIANAIGGMGDYTREGETGWLNRSCSAPELARIMAGLIEQPERVVSLNERVLAERDSIVKPIARHAAEMDAVYRELLRARSGGEPGPS